MSLEVFDIPKSLLDKVKNVLSESENRGEESPERSPLHEVSAPGQEHWIKANKERFEKEYGPEKGKEVLYAKAWKMHEEAEEKKKLLVEKGKKKEEINEKEKETIILNPVVHPDRITEPDKNQKTV
jgi:hypothetical protein